MWCASYIRSYETKRYSHSILSKNCVLFKLDFEQTKGVKSETKVLLNYILQDVLDLSCTFILCLFGTISHVIIFSGICCFLLNKRTSPHFICRNWAKTICYWFWITFIKAECTSKPINYSMCLVLLKSSVWNAVSLSPKKLEKSQKTHGLRGASSHRSQTKEFYRWEDIYFQMNFPSFCSLSLNNSIKVSKIWLGLIVDSKKVHTVWQSRLWNFTFGDFVWKQSVPKNFFSLIFWNNEKKWIVTFESFFTFTGSL